MAAVEGFWTELFGAGDGPGAQVQLRLLRKHGRPFLLLPARRRAAVAALGLYPAQTTRARAARALLGCSLRAGLSAGTRGVSLSLSPNQPFVQFLGSQAGVGPAELPEFGVLAGNPASPGQRFIVLLFDSKQLPVAVVKAGVTGEARALIAKERAFLETIAGRVPGVPRLRGTFESPGLRALVLDYITGQAPRPQHDSSLPALLRAWVDAKRTITLSEAPDWQRLEQVAVTSPHWPALATRLRTRAVHPVIGHGDLAPWNVRISPQGAWMALDWERGETDGIAGWDWFHYILQRAILVERRPTSALAERAEQLLASEDFRRYAEYTGIAGCGRELLLAYLLHCIHVIRPAEGLSQTQMLAEALGRQGRSDAPPL